MLLPLQQKKGVPDLKVMTRIITCKSVTLQALAHTTHNISITPSLLFPNPFLLYSTRRAVQTSRLCHAQLQRKGHLSNIPTHLADTTPTPPTFPLTVSCLCGTRRADPTVRTPS